METYSKYEITYRLTPAHKNISRIVVTARDIFEAQNKLRAQFCNAEIIACLEKGEYQKPPVDKGELVKIMFGGKLTLGVLALAGLWLYHQFSDE